MRRIGPYEVLSELGRGAMGTVYRALDHRLQREVALKVLSGYPDEATSQRFVTEARAIARLHHPNVVSLYDAGVWDGHRVLVLELVEGCLRERLAKGQRLEPREAATLVRDLARGVHAAHQAGILHRDLKPGNVLLDGDGRPRLTDFGLAIDSRSLDSSADEHGTMNGTPAYMAPEQIRGAVQHFGPWTDVWGLGAILHHALSGKPPFGRGAPLERTLRRVQNDPPAEIPDAPPELIAIVKKALQKKPSARFSSAAALADALDAWLAGGRIALERHTDRVLRLAASLTAACLVLLLLAAFRHRL